MKIDKISAVRRVAGRAAGSMILAASAVVAIPAMTPAATTASAKTTASKTTASQSYRRYSHWYLAVVYSYSHRSDNNHGLFIGQGTALNKAKLYARQNCAQVKATDCAGVAWVGDGYLTVMCGANTKYWACDGGWGTTKSEALDAGFKNYMQTALQYGITGAGQSYNFETFQVGHLASPTNTSGGRWSY
jgi:hypothetical protein